MDDRIVGGGPLGEQQRGDDRGPEHRRHDAEGEADRHFVDVGEQHLGTDEDQRRPRGPASDNGSGG